MDEPKNDMIEETALTKLLRVNFTEKERLQMANQMASAVRDRKKEEDDLATVKTQFQSKIKACGGS